MNPIRSNWKVYRVTLENANQEYSQELNPAAMFVLAKGSNRTDSFRVSLKASQVQAGTEYISVFPGGQWNSLGKICGTKTIYLSSSNSGTVIEIEEWT